MGKLDNLRATSGAKMDQSLGKGRPVAPAAGGQGGGTGIPARWQGVDRLVDSMAIPLGMIVRDETQPREEFDEEALDRLAESLKARGQLQPARVRWDEGRGAYVVIVGERRWRAAQRAGLAKLRAVVVEQPIDEGERLMIQLVENALREDLKPVEQAKAYRRLIDAKGYSTRELAGELHVSQSAVVKALALLELAPDLQEEVDQGRLASTAAAEIARIPDPAAQRAVAEVATAEALTRSQITEVVRAVKAKKPSSPPPPPPWEGTVTGGTTVTIRWKRGTGAGPVEVLQEALALAQREAAEGQAA